MNFSPLLLILGILSIVLIVLYIEHQSAMNRYSIPREKIETNYLKFFTEGVSKNYNLEDEIDIQIQKSSKSQSLSADYIEVSSELLKYSFLLNPVRLGVISILANHSQYQQSELRKHLGVSWGKFMSHINALQKAGVVSIHSEFVDSKPMRVLYLEEQGRIQFRELGRILKDLVQPGVT